MSESRLNAWILAARPKTLWAGVAPVLIGTAMAHEAGAWHWPSALCALLGALLLQIAANFANDYFDFVKGADTPDRKGPLRVTQAGLISAEIMRMATVVVVMLACLPGAYIVWRGGWPFVVIGLLSIVFAVLYTGGPYPLGYLGLGDILVLIFFGPLAVGGTYYIQMQEINQTVIVAGLAPGFISMAILTVNNIRDIEQDRVAGKKTLAVRFGRGFAEMEYVTSLFLGIFAVPIALCIMTWGHPWCLLSILVLAAALPTGYTVFMKDDGPSLNKALAATGKLNIIYAIVFSAGWIL